MALNPPSFNSNTANHSLYIVSSVPDAIGFSTATAQSPQGYYATRGGGYGTALWELPTAATAGAPVVHLHFTTLGQALATPRTRCANCPRGYNCSIWKLMTGFCWCGRGGSCEAVTLCGRVLPF